MRDNGKSCLQELAGRCSGPGLLASGDVWHSINKSAGDLPKAAQLVGGTLRGPPALLPEPPVGGAEGPRSQAAWRLKFQMLFPTPSLCQDFQELYVQTGPGRLFVGSTQRFLKDSGPLSLRCNHSIQYDAARGPQPQLVQHLRASAVSSAFDPEAEALRFQLTTALQAGEVPIPSPCPPLPQLKGVHGPECTWLKAQVTAHPLHPLTMDQRLRTETAHLLVPVHPSTPQRGHSSSGHSYPNPPELSPRPQGKGANHPPG